MSATGRSADYPRGILFRHFSLVALAAGCVVLVCLSILTLQLSTIWRAREVRLHEARDAATNVSQAVAQHAHDTIREVDTLLLGLVERGDMLGASGFDQSRMQALLKSRVAEFPQLHAIIVFADDGRPLFNSGTQMPVNLDNPENDYLHYHRLHNDLKPYLGMGAGRLAHGEWIMAVSRRINLPDGSFGGVVLATIRLDYFKKFYEDFSIGEQGTILMTHDDARLVLKTSYDGGVPEGMGSPFKLLSESSSMVKIKEAHASQGLDGKSSIISYRKITEYPLVALTALSRDEVLSGWRNDACLQIAALSALILLTGFFGCRLLSQLSSRLIIEEEFKEASDELKVSNQRLTHLALQDGLTALANRRSFDDALIVEFSRAQRAGNSLGLMMIDVDFFKQYNDIYGHVAGDDCLKKIAGVVATGMRRAGDMAARYGGEEMVLLLPGSDIDGAISLAETIRHGIESLGIPHIGSPLCKVTVSIGVAVFPLIKMETMAITLLNAADHALYKAKASGRNNVCTCDSRERKFSRTTAVEINENWCQEYMRQADISSSER
ncbi:sensor domain-containing diguanylate cyclase [Janthinobacterium sp. LB2P49]|uniref:sensor domain-containing diguanylate cyclase n=1 Tax=Janthinobacterium sp. LB2P49 TaxID=3424198 RepID=UPI003F2464B4